MWNSLGHMWKITHHMGFIVSAFRNFTALIETQTQKDIQTFLSTIFSRVESKMGNGKKQKNSVAGRRKNKQV